MKARLDATVNTITLYFRSSSCIVTLSFTSSLGHCTSCIALYDNSYQPIQYQNIQEIHCLTSNTSITCISIIYSWAGLFQYFLFCHIFCNSIFSIPFLYGRIIQHQIMPVELAYSPWRASHILSPSESHFEVDCFTQYHHIISILPDSNLSYL